MFPPKLLAIADFFEVSPDYLVYGQPTSSHSIDYGPLYRYVDHALADVQARRSRHTAVVARVGRMLADRVDAVAQEVASMPIASRVGLLQDEEGLRLEGHCRSADIVSLSLEFDIIQAGGELAAGRFLPVVAANLEKGVNYRFLLPREEKWNVAVEAFRRLLTRQISGDRVHESCTFRITTAPLLTGAVLYELDTATLEDEEPALHAQIRDYVSDDDWLGCIIRPNSDSDSDMLMDPIHSRRAREAFNLMWSSAYPI